MIRLSRSTCRSLRATGWVAIAVVAGLIAGCKTRNKAPQVAAAPVPVVAAAGPLSAPQTVERLPPPQPVPPEAIPPEPEAATAEPAPAQPPKPLPKPRQTRPAVPPNPNANQALDPATVPPNQPAGGTAAPQLRPVFGAEQERELRARIDHSLTSAEQNLARIAAQPSDRRPAVARVQGFIRQAHQARDQGDLNRARSLAERAELLASDLARSAR